MKSNEIMAGSFEDILFENKNKEYGAYDIRKKYDKNIKISLSIALAVFLLLVLIPVIQKLLTPEEEMPEMVETVTVNEMAAPPPLDEELPPPPDVKIPEIETIKFVPPVVVEKVTKEEKIHTVEEVKEAANVGSKDIEGEKIVITEPVKDIIKTEEKEEPLTFVEQMPSFPDGDAALQKFIAEHIKYPPQGLEFGLQGTVWVQFTVGKDGKITDPKVIKSVKGGFDEEAIRVVKMLPPWKPGKQNGREVPVYVKLPIKFTLK
jgi:periplasmic protein TonB